jgi:hypothetical protein
LAGLLMIVTVSVAVSASDFSVREYNEFHDVLHPLEHEALPSKKLRANQVECRRICETRQSDCAARSTKNTDPGHAQAFRAELKKFKGALDRFKRDARDGTDTQLENSFSAVHDSFEMLVGMLPRK